MADEHDQDQGTPEFTEAELALMTEEERKAVLEGGHEDRKAVSGQEGEVNDGEKEKGGGEKEAERQGEGGREEVGGKAETPAEMQQQAPGAFVPFLQMGGGEDDLQAKLDDLDKQLEEGDIDIIQYTKERDPLIQQRTEARLAAKFNEQSRDQLWKYEQNLFFNSNPEYRDDPVLNGALQRIFRSLDTQENAGKTGLELLTEAHKQVEASLAARYGGGVKTPGAEQGKQQNQAKDQRPQLPKQDKPARDRVNLPRTLSDVPIAEANDTGQGEFAHLDNLSGIEFERALARLTPDQQDRYLRQ